MKILFYIIPILFAFVIGFMVGSKMNNKPAVVVKKVVVTETKFIKRPVTVQEYKDCALSPITITAKSNNDVIHVVASDKCKVAEADITVSTKTPIGSIVAGVVLIGVIIILL